MKKHRPIARVERIEGNEGKDVFYDIVYSCHGCHRKIEGGYHGEEKCEQCGTVHDWGKRMPGIVTTRRVEW